jgi:hypothetical protein
MPTATYTPLGNATLATAASSLTFSSIPTTPYRDLILVIDNVSTSANSQFNFRFNSDTGANYSNVYTLGASDGVTSFTDANETQGRLGNIGTSPGNHILQVLDYSATDKHKSLLMRSNIVGASQTWMSFTRWASTTAVTSIRIFVGTGTTMPAGATFSLYGVIS